MIASLGMYLRPETEAATDRYWHSIRDRLRASGLDAPQNLTRQAMFDDVWSAPDLLLSQTCGMPYRLNLHGKVTLVGTPDYGINNCPPGYYASPYVVRLDDPRQNIRQFEKAVFAYTDKQSQSGWAAPQNDAALHGFRFENLCQSGGHISSAKAVAEGRADISALDSMSWKLMQRYDDFAATLRVLEVTQPTPGLPYITGLSNDASVVFDAVSGAIAELSAADRAVLCLHGLIKIPANDYLAVPNP